MVGREISSTFGTAAVKLNPKGIKISLSFSFFLLGFSFKISLVFCLLINFTTITLSSFSLLNLFVQYSEVLIWKHKTGKCKSLFSFLLRILFSFFIIQMLSFLLIYHPLQPPHAHFGRIDNLQSFLQSFDEYLTQTRSV